jgi:hypothetical protein
LILALCMIASFFQRLEASGVRYLLISGQATILYGAATFSEDVDIWLKPESVNLVRFMDVLRSVRARYYKLTPPVTLDNLGRGHGFHFVLPSGEDGQEVYLDVMGRPPRVASFDEADAGARVFDTDFGRVRTVGIRALVEIKKTQRPEDYPVVGRLALAYLDDPTTKKTDGDLRWALDNVFSLNELHALLVRHLEAYQRLSSSLPEVVGKALAALTQASTIPTALEDELDAWSSARSEALRREDRRYWKSIIEELRSMRRDDKLLREGTLV